MVFVSSRGELLHPPPPPVLQGMPGDEAPYHTCGVPRALCSRHRHEAVLYMGSASLAAYCHFCPTVRPARRCTAGGSFQ